MTNSLYPLFPTPIGVYEINRTLSETERSVIDNLPNYANTNNTISYNKSVLDIDALGDVNLFLNHSLNDYFQNVHHPIDDVEIFVTQSWVNWTNPGESHHRHYHPNSFVSGVFYIEADETSDKIMFHRSSADNFEISTSEFNMYNSLDWWFNITSGMLILFPSYIEHSVPKVTGSKTRISLAFNTFIRGQIGKEDRPTLLSL